MNEAAVMRPAPDPDDRGSDPGDYPGLELPLVPAAGLVLLKLFVPPLYDGAWLVFRDGGVPAGVISPAAGRLLADADGRAAAALVCGDRGRADASRCAQVEALFGAGLLVPGTDAPAVHWVAPDSVEGTRHRGEGADLFIRYFYHYFGSVFHDGSSLIDSHGDFLPVLERYYPCDRAGLDCVDLGCGSGYYAAALARRGHRVYAVDIDDTRLAAARDRDAGAGSIVTVAGDIEDVPLPSGGFDFVMCNFVMEHVADHFAVADEIARLLRPGGRYALAVPSFNIRDTIAYWLYGEAPSLNFEHLRSFGLVPGTHPWCAPTTATIDHLQSVGLSVDDVEGAGILDHLFEPWASHFHALAARHGDAFARTWPWNCLGQQTLIHGRKRDVPA